MNKNSLILANIKFLLIRELKDIKKISLASNTSLDINLSNTLVDLAILSHSILTIK